VNSSSSVDTLLRRCRKFNYFPVSNVATRKPEEEEADDESGEEEELAMKMTN
jgi:hypothetical protein